MQFNRLIVMSFKYFVIINKSFIYLSRVYHLVSAKTFYFFGDTMD